MDASKSWKPCTSAFLQIRIFQAEFDYDLPITWAAPSPLLNLASVDGKVVVHSLFSNERIFEPHRCAQGEQHHWPGVVLAKHMGKTA